MLLDNSSQRPWMYYLRYDDVLSTKTKRAVPRAFKPRVVWGGKQFLRRIRRLARKYKGQEFWVVTSKPHFNDKVRAELDRRCKRVEVTPIHIHSIMRCVTPKR